MALLRKFRESTKDKTTKVCLNTDNVMLFKDMEMEVLKMRDTNYQLKESVRLLHENSAKMKQEAHHQQMIISSLKILHEEIVTKKEEEAREMEMKATACSVVQKVMTQALTKLVAEKDDEAAVKDSMLSQTKVRDLEAELDAKQRRHQETLKNLRKNELRLKEMTFQSDEDHKKQERLQELVEKMQQKINTYKTQSDEVRDLEAELDAEQRRHQETLKNLRKNELRLKEMTFQSDEDRKKQERLQELVDKLQRKIKTHKTQSEASIDLTKAVYEMTTMSQDKQIKELQSALNCTKMEKEIFKVLATARRKKEEEEEKHMSNGNMEEMAMRHHQEQARYLGQAWQEATSGTCNMHDPDDRNHHQHPG
ncbi:uncharacterized protein LOC144875118 isoform X2 [Branchiostoma floridae x Branchiostoma japonicum]